MPLMKEAMTKANFDRVERGLAPLKPEKVDKIEPEKPITDDEILASDIKKGYTINLERANRIVKSNPEGVKFVCYDIKIDLTSKKDSLTLEGWMVEGEFLQFLRNNRSNVDTQVICW